MWGKKSGIHEELDFPFFLQFMSFPEYTHTLHTDRRTEETEDGDGGQGVSSHAGWRRTARLYRANRRRNLY